MQDLCHKYIKKIILENQQETSGKSRISHTGDGREPIFGYFLPKTAWILFKN